MKAIELIRKAKRTTELKTLYVVGGDGVALNNNAKLKLSSIAANVNRTKKIFDSSEDTIAFDEFSFFKYLTDKPVSNFGNIMECCHDISKNFVDIVPGEIVFMQDRFGIYVGDDKVVAISSAGVGYTIAQGWISHGKLNGVDYDDERKVDGDSEGKTEEEPVKADEQRETRVEVRPDRAGSRDRVQQMPSQNKGHDRGNGRHRS